MMSFCRRNDKSIDRDDSLRTENDGVDIDLGQAVSQRGNHEGEPGESCRQRIDIESWLSPQTIENRPHSQAID